MCVMKSSRAILIGLAALAAMLAVLGLRPREPVHEGKRLSQWLEGFSLYQQEDTEEPEFKAGEAAAAIRQMGTNVVPHLVRLLRVRDSPVRQALMHWAQRQSLVRVSFVPASDYHHRAVEAFRALGRAAASALPALGRLLDDPATCAPAARALAAIGTNGFPLLEAALTNQNAEVRAEAIVSLANDRDHPQRVTPILIRQLKHPDPWVRGTAVQGLSSGRSPTPEVLSALLEAARDPSPAVRAPALQGLQFFPAATDRTVPVLLRALDDSGDVVRCKALGSLLELAPAEPQIVVPALTAKLDRLNPLGRRMAAQVLARYGPRAQETVPVLLRLIANQNPDDNVVLRSALQAIAPQAAAQSPARMEPTGAGSARP